MRHFYIPLTGLCLALLLSACGPLISFGSDDPAAVYSLTYDGESVDMATGPVLFVEEPVMTQDLGGRRVAVSLPDFERTFIKDARWTTSLGDLIRGYITQATTAHTKGQAMGEGALDVVAVCRVGATVWNFDFIPSDRGDEVHIKLEIAFVRISDGHLLGRRLFERTETVHSADSRGVVVGFNGVMATMMGDITGWLDGMIDACAA